MHRFLQLCALALVGGSPVPSADAATCLDPSAGVAPPASMRGVWAGTLTRQGEPWSVELSIGQTDDDGPAHRFSATEFWWYDLPAEVWTADDEHLCVRTRYPNGILTLRRTGPETFEGTFKSESYDAEAELTKTRKPPRDYVERNFVFHGKDGIRLAATYIAPPGPGPFATILWTHASPPNTRSTPHYAGRAYMAARAGAASVIWDKRAAGESAGEVTYDLQILVDDAEAALGWALEAPGVDRDRIIIAGASQGGWVAPALAARRPAVVAGVLVASAPGADGAEQNIYSMTTRLSRAGLEHDRVEAAAEGLRRVYGYYRTGQGYPDIRAMLDDPANADWVETPIFKRLTFMPEGKVPPDIDPTGWQVMFYDPVPWWRTISVPVLAFWGADDISVNPERGRRVIGEALSAAGNRDAVLWVFPAGGHGLEWSRPSDQWLRTAPGVQELMFGWIMRQTMSHGVPKRGQFRTGTN